MICKTCGMVLKDNDKFCSNCGTWIDAADAKQAENIVFTAPGQDFEWNVHAFPGENQRPTGEINFDWGITEGEFSRRPDMSQGVATVAPVPSGDVAQQQQAQQPAQQQVQQAVQQQPQQQMQQPVQSHAQQSVNQQVTQPQQQPQTVQAEQPVQTEQPEQQKAQDKPAQKKGFFARFTKDKNVTMEQPAMTEEMIREAEELRRLQAEEQERIRQTEEQAQAAQTTQAQAIQAQGNAVPQAQPQGQQVQPEQQHIRTEHIDFDWTQQVTVPQQVQPQAQQQIQTQPVSQAPTQQKTAQPQSSGIPEAVFSKNELMEEHPDDIKGEELERELFGGAAVAGIVDGSEGLSRQTEQIDKFYTFNRKTEEFQKLLDDEYEKFRAGKPLDNSTFAANVEAIKEKNEMAELEEKIRADAESRADDPARRTSVIQQAGGQPIMASDEDKIKEMFASQDSTQNDGTGVTPGAYAENGADGEEKSKSRKFSFGKKKKDKAQSDETAADAGVLQQQTKTPETAGSGEENEPKGREGLAGKIAIIVLSIILAMLLIALGIKLIAPGSAVSEKIDNVANSIMSVFTGEETEKDNEAESKKADDTERNTFKADLNGVIQSTIEDNFNNYIAKIAYDPDLKYEKKTQIIKTSL